jgi:outer membrane protein
MTTKCATALLWGIGIAVLPQTGAAQVFTVRASRALAPQPSAAAQQTPPASPASPASPAAQSPSPAPASAAQGPVRVMTLDDALGLAEAKNEQIAIATAGITRAQGEEMRARSEIFPQFTASASYDRALATQFEGIFDTGGPACTPLTVNPAAPIADRIAEIERALQDCPPSSNFFGGGSGSGSGSGDGGDGESENELPFGQANTIALNLIFSQNIYTGGRIEAQRQRARLARTNSELTLNATRAQLSYDVSVAYLDAALSDRLVLIAEETFAQAERTFEQTRQQREAGRMAEFDLLRAQVARDTQRPEVIRRRNARDLAYLRLKQLIDLPLDTPIQLATRFEDNVLPAPAQRFANAIAEVESGTELRERLAIAQATNDVRSREQDVRIARAQRLPAISLNSTYSRIGYPTSSASTWNDFRTNWNVGVGLSIPLFTGWRIKADEIVARASVEEQQARLQLTRELATLDAASTKLSVTDARAAWEATAGVIQQAQRAYEIAELRYREGLSTQLELSDARLLLQQAQANRAQAARDVQVARVRLALLPDLPLTDTGANTPTGLASGQGAGAAARAQQGQTQQTGQTGTQGTTGAAGTTGTTGTTGAQPR